MLAGAIGQTLTEVWVSQWPQGVQTDLGFDTLLGLDSDLQHNVGYL